MRPVVVTVVLLLVGMFIKESAADEICGSGWNHVENGHCVMMTPYGKTFNEAESFCQNEGGHLLTVDDVTIMDTLAYVLGSNIRFLFWVGPKRPEVQWNDENGKLFYDSLENYDCIIVLIREPLIFYRTEFFTEACDGVHRFLCEKTV